MKKILLILTLSLITILGTGLEVRAKNASFYEAEYLDNIYMIRYDKVNNIKYYQRARKYRRISDGKIAYCLQPFKGFNLDANDYESVDSMPFINNETINKLSDIIGFGYNNFGHTEEKWYAITQMLIWQTVEPNSEFYFTDKLNGNKIEPYNNEIATINNLISNSYKMPSFNNQTYYGIINKPLTITDTNNIIPFFGKDKYSTTTLSGNSLTVKKDKAGCYDEYFTRYYNTSNDPVLFYYNKDSQSLATIGNTNNRNVKVTYCFNELKLNLKKVDKDTKTTKSLGEASLENTEFTLYDENMKELTKIKLNNDMESSLTSSEYDFLDYGKYYLKESKKGIGYLENDTVYEIEFTKDNTNINLTIENEVLKKELTIKKYFGDGILMEAEKNITFEIYDKHNNLINEITTDEFGLAKITLPYGHYKIVQINTTKGYTKIQPFNIFINDIDKDYTYIINDYKEKEEITIEVPNTSTNNNNYLLLNTIFTGLIIVKKKFI